MIYISKIYLLAILIFITIIPSNVMGQEMFAGQLEGYNCTIFKVACVVDKNDPRLYLEPDIIFQTNNKNYYHLTNLPNRIKFKYFRENVRIVGMSILRYKQIIVDKFQVKKDGNFTTVWDA